MAGNLTAPPPRPAAGAPQWAVALARDIVDWVLQIGRGPQALTGFTSTMKPDATKNAYALIADKTAPAPNFSDGTAWNIVASYTTGLATAVANAGTINARAGKLTTEALTTAAGATQTLTIANSTVAATDIVLCSVANGTSTTGVPVIGNTVPGAGSFTVDLRNVSAAAAFNGTLVVSFLVLKV